jgi:hypothetical protein
MTDQKQTAGRAEVRLTVRVTATGHGTSLRQAVIVRRPV